MESKTCSKCGVSHPMDFYNADSRRKDGKRAVCRPCDSAQKKAIRERSLELYREKNRLASKRWREAKKKGQKSKEEPQL